MDPENSGDKSKNNLVIMGIIVIAIIALVATGGFLIVSKNKTNTPQPNQTIDTNQVEENIDQTEKTPSSSNYKDGSYNAIGNYISPGGAETIKVSVTLADGVITDATVEPQAFRPNSIKFQGLFAGNCKPMIVGKNIDDVKLDKVAGSSLAPKGFNDALSQIKIKASVSS